jgi:hypothetical protein
MILEFRAPVWALGGLCLVACSGGDAVSMGSRAPEQPVMTDDGACARENQTSACECLGGMRGSRSCTSGRWSECQCIAPAPIGQAGSGAVGAPEPAAVELGNFRDDITFDWTRTTPDDLACEPGHYEGSFAGLYYSRINWPIPFPVVGVDLPGFPGLQFDMLPAQNGEVTLKVDGKFDGLADGLFPFRGDFIGELDCRTGKFTGMMLNASYNIGPMDLIVVTNPILFNFAGPVSADYDKVTHTFVNGTWDAVEELFGGTPAPTLPRDPLRDGVGGSGVWSTGWIGKPVDYKCPDLTADGLPLACQAGPFGLNKTFCVYPALLPGARADGPICETDAECQAHFPGTDSRCVDINGDGVVVRCLQECAP